MYSSLSVAVDSHVCAQEVQKKAAEFLSFVKDECTTTQKTVKAVIDGVDELFQLYNKYLQVFITLKRLSFAICESISLTCQYFLFCRLSCFHSQTVTVF